MIETQTNGHSNHQDILKTIKFKINHPKLHNQIFTFSKAMPFRLLQKELKRDNMLSLFSNYHFEVDEQPIRSQKDYAQLIHNNPKDVYQIDLAFDHYNYATAMYHFKAVSQLLKNPNKINSILKSTHKTEASSPNELDMEVLASQLVPQAYRGYKWDVEEVISPNYKGNLHLPRTEKIELLHFIQYSGFNPPPEQAQFAGDLFYIHLKTLQNLDIHITACANGFYINQSKINCYNPSIQTGKPTYSSLLDLILTSSDKFAANFNRIIDNNPTSFLQKIYKKISPIVSNYNLSQQNNWLDYADHDHHWNARKNLTFGDLEDIPQDYRDWNQQFVQLSRLGEKIDYTGQIGRRWESQAYKQLYKDFKAAAADASRRILDGKVKAINYMDEEKRHIYIYNKIFMSATTETPYDHKLSKEEEVLPSSSSVSTDILNLQLLNSLKPQGLRLLQTVLVSYRGWRMLVQTIIPGLLTSQLNAITLYGALDDSKSIQADERFRSLLLPLCKKMHLEQNIEAIDKSQGTIKIAVSPQIKGIKSTSGEYFLCDLQKFSPRDLNYLGLEHQGCVLRHKLINQYIEDNKIDFSTTPSINTNIATDTKFVPGPHYEQQEQFLKNAAKYLKEAAVPKLISALRSKNPGDFLTDSAGISAIFHEFGINMRYLGFVERHDSLKDNIQVRVCLTRVILVRSLKHLFRSVLRSSGHLHISTAASYVLNCIFGRKNIINLLSTVLQATQQKVEQNQSKKKRKRKNRQEQKQVKVTSNQQNRSIKTQPCPYLAMKPQQIWEQVCRIAKARFDHQFEPNIFAFHQKGLFRLLYQKYATLRDLCLCIGMVIERKEYQLSEKETSQSPPFHPKNILYFNAISKTIKISLSPQLVSLKAEADRLFASCSYKEALTTYNTIINSIKQHRQGESFLSYCLGQVSRIQYMLGNLREAIVIETQNLVFSQKTGREDCLEVTRCYSRLGLYCMSLGAKQLSLWLLYKGLHLMLVSFGEAYPDILINFANIARVHQQNKQPNLASNCYLKAIDLLAQVYGGKNHVNTSFCYSSLASLHYQLAQYRKSAEYQNQAVTILQKVLSNQDVRYTDAVKILKMYRQFANNKGGNRTNQNSRDRKK